VTDLARDDCGDRLGSYRHPITMTMTVMMTMMMDWRRFAVEEEVDAKLSAITSRVKSD
jgi:hypothetical protein